MKDIKDKNIAGWGVSVDSIIFRFNSQESAMAFVDFVKMAWDGYLDNRKDRLDVRVFWIEERRCK